MSEPTREQMQEFMANASSWSEWGWDGFGHHVTLESVCDGYLALLDRVERLERENAELLENERVTRIGLANLRLWARAQQEGAK